MVANILVGPIVHLAPLFASYVKPGGEVCLSRRARHADAAGDGGVRRAL